MPWISVKDAAAMLDGAISVQVVYNCAHSGKVLSTKIAGKICIDKADWQRVIDEGRQAVLKPAVRQARNGSVRTDVEVKDWDVICKFMKARSEQQRE